MDFDVVIFGLSTLVRRGRQRALHPYITGDVGFAQFVRLAIKYYENNHDDEFFCEGERTTSTPTTMAVAMNRTAATTTAETTMTQQSTAGEDLGGRI